MRKTNITEMRKIAEWQGGQCLSDNYISAITKLKWQCKDGHTWEARPHDIKRGKWCPSCSGNIKLTITEMQEIAKSRGGFCLSDTYINNETKLKWRCKEGHTWEAIPNSIKRGTWCSICGYKNSADKRKLPIQIIQTVAKSKGGELLSKEYLGGHINLKWRCKEGHIWNASPSNVKNHNRWCPYCARRAKLTIEEMQKIAKSRGGQCISEEYTNARSKLQWKCKDGHVWEATPTNIQGGRWCPICSIGISERICQKYFETIFNESFPKIRPQWLRTGNGSLMELDGYCEKLNLAFEYQGIQHYENVKKFHQKYTLKERKEMDSLKKDRCKQHNITLIEVPYTISYEDMGSYIIRKCRENGIKVPDLTKTLNYKLFNIYSPERLKEMQEIALSREGECLSKIYFNSQKKLSWKCKLGHIFESNANNIKNGNWCPYCVGKNKTLEDMQRVAVKMGGKCLSKKYINTNHKLLWQCKDGHTWMAIPTSILKGHWCRFCGIMRTSEKQKLSIEDMHKLAEKKKGKCLSKTYVNVGTKLEWQCEKGHIWVAKPNNIKTGNWCPFCYKLRRKRMA